MNRYAYIALASFVLAAFGTGCAESAQATAPTTPSAQTAEKWETVKLANGVELKVSEEAGPEARRVVEQIQSEMRSRYISAR